MSSSNSRWYAGLNPEQVKACGHNYGPLLILAGAGSGKTTTLVSRTGRLIDEKIAAPENICVLTFTNKSARELKHRVSQKLFSAQKLWTGTFHSFGVRTLKIYHKQAHLPKQFGILDQQDCVGLVREILKDFNLYKKDKFDSDLILSNISRWRERGQIESITEQDYDVVTEWILPKYEKKKEILGVVDFDDLILKVIDLYKKNPEVLAKDQGLIDQLMVDEFQDTNNGQMKLIEYLVGEKRNITVVGDDDQSIYGWRGAQVQNILDFPKQYQGCIVIKLEKNYRSTPQILNLANNVISKNEKRHNKILIPRSEESIPASKPEVFVFDLETDEIEGVVREIKTFKDRGYEYKDQAVLFRANAQGAFLEAILRERSIPYKISGGMSFLDRKEVKDAHAYLKCAMRLSDIDFRRILNTPSRGIGDTSIEKIVESSRALQSTFIKACKNWANLDVPTKAGASIDNLFQNLSELKAQLLSDPEPPGKVLLKFMENIGYKKLVFDISKDMEMGTKRWALVDIYTQILSRYIDKRNRSLATFEDFIMGMDLKDQEDDEEKKNEVQLLTLHACKGLEFPCVIMVGIEEDILPHRKLGSDITEERRLFYVGVTRAQEHLMLTLCRKRQVNGRYLARLPSRFLEEIDKSLYTRYEQGARPTTVDERKKMLSDLINSL